VVLPNHISEVQHHISKLPQHTINHLHQISEERTVPQSRHGRGWVLVQIISGFIEFDINNSARVPSILLPRSVLPDLLRAKGQLMDGAREAFMKSMEGAAGIQYCSSN
jgi:hypothetical protein